MDGASPKLSAAAGAMVIAIVLFAASAVAQPLAMRASCRDGQPHGAWQLQGPSGALRALGAFNHGRRTGSFIFWNAAGVRIAHVPYEDDAKNGTLAVWRETPTQGGEGPQRLEAVYAMGKLHGVKRVWHPDGRVRGEYAYVDAVLVEVKAWDARGRPLAEQAARAQAALDFAADEAFLASLDAHVTKHLPDCRNGNGGVAPR